MDIIENAITLTKNGDNSAFEAIINFYRKSLFRYCYHMLGNIPDAEDAIQEIFIKVYDNLNSYKSSTNFSAWIYRISYNYCVNFLSRKKLLSFLPLLDGLGKYTSNTDDAIFNLEYGAEINLALKKLSKKDTTIVVLRCVEEKSYDEISEVVKLKPATVRKRYERARKKLRVTLENNSARSSNSYPGAFKTIKK